MDFHELEAFLVLADNLHFARAASQIHLSPSALSRLLVRLEEELGVSLFERDTRQVSLTSEGESFLSFARESIHRREDLLLKLGERDDNIRGILRVYASVTACYSILPPFVEALAIEHPGLRLSVETGDPADAADAIRESRAELALDAIPPKGFRDLECHSVRTTPLVFVASRSGAYGNLKLAVEPSAIQQQTSSVTSSTQAEALEISLQSIPVVLPKSGLARDRFDRWVRIHDVKPIIAAETAGNEAVLALARLGLGLGLVPRLVLENSPFAEGLILYDAGPEFGDYDIGFIQKSAVSGTDAARKLRTEITRIIRKTYPKG